MKLNTQLLPVVAAICILFFSSTLTAQDGESRTFFVQVNKANQLVGQVIEVTELKVSTGFGEVTIPIDKIEAVKMNVNNEGQAVIAFTNGDMVTGNVDLDELHIKTTWGKAHINASAIDSFSTSQYGRFYADTTAGGWRYSRGTAAASQPRMTSPTPANSRSIQNTFNRGG